jgi:flagellar basal-body rod protein FlgG
MIRALYSAASGMAAEQMSVDNIANNLANSNTNGFKMRRTQFQDLIYQSYVQPGAAAGAQTIVPSGLQLGLGTRPASNEIIFSQGNYQQTGNPLDLVIQGKGFFQVLRPTGEVAYTRDGGFQFDRNGNIVTANGDPIQPQITIPPQAQNVTIAADGTVSYTQPGQAASQVAGQIQLANFTNPGGLNGDRCVRRPYAGDSRRSGGARLADARLRRGLKCKRGRGVHQPDREPARL